MCDCWWGLDSQPIIYSIGCQYQDVIYILYEYVTKSYNFSFYLQFKLNHKINALHRTIFITVLLELYLFPAWLPTRVPSKSMSMLLIAENPATGCCWVVDNKTYSFGTIPISFKGFEPVCLQSQRINRENPSHMDSCAIYQKFGGANTCCAHNNTTNLMSYIMLTVPVHIFQIGIMIWGTLIKSW